jgi:DMSO reductase anchor subunit
VIKQPVWSWESPLYFFTGGLGGASAGLAYLSELRGNEVLARRAWATALAGIALSPGLLVSDLGRPTRCLNMLRMFKVTSPMSVGSWILAASGTTTAVAAANEWTGLFGRPARLARPAAAVLGLPLSTYTAALIANTAVPVWHESRRLLPFVFASGAALSAGAAAVAVTPPRHARPARRLALASVAVEAGCIELMKRRLAQHREPYDRGAPARLGQIARACFAGGAALLFCRGGTSRAAAAVAGGLLSAGALSARLSTFRAGFQSASDPSYVIGPQRAGIEAGARRGAARREARLTGGEPATGSPATAPLDPTKTPAEQGAAADREPAPRR